jgi:uncharacterized protein YbjQ (UPF0145 family)
MGTADKIAMALNFGLPLLILLGAYLIGNYLERRHFRKIMQREDDLQGFPVTTFEKMPSKWQIQKTELVTGSVVVSLDYFKRVIAGLRILVGGRVKTYEPLLERARREALLRMTELAKSQGYDAVVNVRLETSRLANASGKREGIAGIEMLAFGTAISVARPQP